MRNIRVSRATYFLLLLSVTFVFIGIALLKSIQQPEIHRTALAPKVTPIPDRKPQTIIQNSIKIPSIGVDMEIDESPRTLSYGGWVEKSFYDIPAVIAVHRFGWYGLTQEQKRRQTLFNADKLKQGDQVVVTWKSQQYVYAISRIVVSTNNPSLINGQLLLYTCNDWDSNKRIFIILQRQTR